MASSQTVVSQAKEYVEKHMAHFDGSHDFSHIKRVLGISHMIYQEMKKWSGEGGSVTPTPELDLEIITLSALLHDVCDRKYLKEGQDKKTLVRDLLLSFGAGETLASNVQTICLGVSYSSEIKDLQHVRDVIEKHPELAVVQDADRLDAIGAIGVGRVFTYGGSKTTRGMDGSVQIMDDKLFSLEGLMKTDPGKRMARERASRLETFRKWWEDEVGVEEYGLSALSTASWI